MFHTSYNMESISGQDCPSGFKGSILPYLYEEDTLPCIAECKANNKVVLWLSTPSPPSASKNIKLQQFSSTIAKGEPDLHVKVWYVPFVSIENTVQNTVQGTAHLNFVSCWLLGS